VEFAAALIILVFFVFIPLLDLTIVPIRWMLAQELVNDYGRKLALCESFSDSFKMMEADPSLTTRLRRLGGVDVKSIKLHMRISRVFLHPHKEEVLIVSTPGKVPAEWLPNGAKAPCTYALELDIGSLISPAIMLPKHFGIVPGLSAPIPLLITSTHAWENCARNPATGHFFINE
jgi:hypothetical protein